MNFYISDLHLNHENVTQSGKNFDNRPFKDVEQMSNVIERNWNSVVKNSDTVYILGDVVWRLDENVISMFARLKGKKVLVLGNHDNRSLKDHRFSILFDEIVPYKEIVDNISGKQYKLILSHYPIMFYNGQHKKDVIHLYGHVHNSEEWDFYKKYITQLIKDVKHKKTKMDRDIDFNPITINVGCMVDYINYTPRTLKELLESNNVNIN